MRKVGRIFCKANLRELEQKIPIFPLVHTQFALLLKTFILHLWYVFFMF